jgi:hypothetical protein
MTCSSSPAAHCPLGSDGNLAKLFYQNREARIEKIKFSLILFIYLSCLIPIHY